MAPPGHVLLSADYAQLELRLMAHFSEDTALCQLLCDPSHDPFFHLAMQWLQLSPEQVIGRDPDGYLARAHDGVVLF